MSESLPLPAGLRWLRIVCRLGQLVHDGTDLDDNPDLLPNTGRVVIKANPRRIRILEPDGRWRMISIADREYNIRSDGELVDLNGNIGVKIPDPASPLVDPAPYTATFAVTPTAGEAWSVGITGDGLPDVIDLAAHASTAPIPASAVPSLESRLASLEANTGGSGVEVSTYVIVGPGRPDTPATTGGTITGSEPVGAEYRSTDGAGVGAHVWRKVPAGYAGRTTAGWVVVDGDTGPCYLDSTFFALGATSAATIRRIGNRVQFKAYVSEKVYGATIITFPTGFTGDPTANVSGALKDGRLSPGLITDVTRTGVNSGTSTANLVWLGTTLKWHGTNVSETTVYYFAEWIANQPWPATLPGVPLITTTY